MSESSNLQWHHSVLFVSIARGNIRLCGWRFDFYVNQCASNTEEATTLWFFRKCWRHVRSLLVGSRLWTKLLTTPVPRGLNMFRRCYMHMMSISIFKYPTTQTGLFKVKRVNIFWKTTKITHFCRWNGISWFIIYLYWQSSLRTCSYTQTTAMIIIMMIITFDLSYD